MKSVENQRKIKKSLNPTEIFIIVLSIIALICFITSSKQGMLGILQNFIASLAIIIVMSYVFIVALHKLKLGGEQKKSAKIVIGVMPIFILFFAYKVIVCIMGVCEGITVVQCDEYSVEHNRVRKAHDTYELCIYSNGEIKKEVYITLEQYRELKNCIAPITVEYYPHVNIADDITIME